MRSAVTSNPLGLESDVAMGVSGTVNVLRPRERDRFSFTYTPSYTRRARYSDWNATNHFLRASYHRSLAPRLRFTVSASGRLMNFEDFQFSATPLSDLASRPGTAANLADLLASRSQDWLTTGIADGPGEDSALYYLLYGRRVFSSAVQAIMSYSKSPRTSLYGGFEAGRSQRIFSGEEREGVYSGVTSHITHGMVMAGISHSLSHRTTMSLRANSTRQSMRGIALYLTTVSGSLERMMTANWFVRGNIRLGTVTSSHNEERPARPLQVLGGGGLGYRRSSHTWLASYDRRIGDAYGVGRNAAHSTGASYRWFQPAGGHWSFEVSGSRYRVVGEPRMESWRGIAGLGKRLSSNTNLQIEYAYTYYKHTLSGAFVTLGQGALRAHFVWSPGAPRTP